VSHFVYLSVAQPAPVMQAYVGVRARVESLIADAKLRATCLRPWYVLGPGHRWPYALAPLYWLWGKLPTTRETARRLGLVSLDEMVSALVYAVESPPPSGVRVLDVPAIRRAALGAGAAEG
jgi:nucleoside-diphosphate-sugar epimerase